MKASGGNLIKQALKHALAPKAEDRAWQETAKDKRHASLGPRPYIDNFIIRDRTGMARDITTGRPPTMKAEARDAWAKAREEASIDKLFK